MDNLMATFVLLVEDMRDAQSHYFKTRTQKALKEAIELETKVDRSIQLCKMSETDLYEKLLEITKDG